MRIAQNFSKIFPLLNLNFARVKAPDPRITFARATTATYYNKQTAKAEENLLLYSQEFDIDLLNWILNGATVVVNAVSAPDSTNT